MDPNDAPAAADAQVASDASPTPPEPTPMDAVSRAFDAVEAMDKGEPEKPAAKPEGEAPAEGARERNPDGTFKAKAPDPAKADGEDAEKALADANKGADKDAEKKPDADTALKADDGFTEPPSRFSADAKAAWKDAPAPVRAEVHRAVKELEAGVEKYRNDAQAFDQIRDFDTLARQHNTSIRTALENYTNLERTIASDPIKGLQAVCDYAGVSLRDVAAHVMGQAPDANASQQDATIRELRQHITSLEQKLDGVSTSISEQKNSAVLKDVEAFAAANPRFDELSEEISRQIKGGFDLAEAYRRAELLNPVPQATQAEADAAVQPAPKPDPSAQTRKGSLSVTGSPGAGSDPGNRTPPSSAHDALDRAFGQLGIG
jgi:hypothetical protein